MTPDPKSQIPNPKSVAVVIPTYNNISLLLECLEAVRGLDYPKERVEVVVVDNGSTDRTVSVLGSRFPQVKLVQLESNKGFAPACNRGALEADADFVAFLNNDAIPDPQWLNAMFAALEAGGEDAVCAASRIMSRDGDETEFDGAGSNLFGAGRPHSDWGWADQPNAPVAGSPLLFASGGAMLIERDVFLAVGGFDPAYFAYFEDVDLGWRLWVLGHRVVYAPDAIVRHIGGATGRRSGLHRRYTLWESNSLATIVKNYESGNMERILSAALLLEYRRALMSAGDAFEREDYRLGAPPDKNSINVERLPKVSVAHLAGVSRLNALLPHLMSERARIQDQRKRSDSEILPLLGRAFEPQFAGSDYAGAAKALYAALDLYGITGPAAPRRLVLVGTAGEAGLLEELARKLKEQSLVAIAIIGGSKSEPVRLQDGSTLHNFAADGDDLSGLIGRADAVVATPLAAKLSSVKSATPPVATWGSLEGLQRGVKAASAEDPILSTFYL